MVKYLDKIISIEVFLYGKQKIRENSKVWLIFFKFLSHRKCIQNFPESHIRLVEIKSNKLNIKILH